MKTLKTTLPLLLKKKGWTYDKLSKVTGIPRSTLHSWTSQNAVSLDQLKIVATALEVSLHFLAFGSPDPQEDSSDEILEKIFSGDIRVTLHKISKKQSK